MPEDKLSPGSNDQLARKNSTGSNASRRKQQVSENVVKRMSMKPEDGSTTLAPADFTIHITEAGEEVRTTSRIIKGKFE